MFTPKHLLVNCATLLCLEHRNGVSVSHSSELIGNVVEALPIPEGTIDHDHGRQTFLELRQLVIWLKSKAGADFPTDQEVLQTAQIACKEQTWLFEAIMSPLVERYPDTQSVVQIIQNLRGTLHKFLNDEIIRAIVKETSHRLMFKRDVTDPLAEVRGLAERLEPHLKARSEMSHPAMMGRADFGDPEAMVAHFENVKESLSTDGALQMGWKGVNRMLGSVGAMRRGERVLIGGLQHNFKSGFMLSLFVHACMFNAPKLRDRTKKPLIVFFTFENQIGDNILWIYKYIKENITGEPVIDSQVNAKEAAAYVKEHLQATGFEVRMYQFDPTELTASAFTGLLDGLIAEGYEIVATFIDYLNLLSKSGIDAKVAGDDIRLLFRRVYNYTAPRGILCISPHQLSSEALQLTRDNVADFVTKIANRGYYDGCKRLGQEPDLEILIHKVIVNGDSFLTIQRGKHRNVVTSEKDQYVVLPFSPIGTIKWDVDKDHEVTCQLPNANGGYQDDGADDWMNNPFGEAA